MDDKKKRRRVGPHHLLRKKNYVGDDVAKQRLDVCKSCPQLIRSTMQCKECGCFMHLKTRLIGAECPLAKW